MKNAIISLIIGLVLISCEKQSEKAPLNDTTPKAEQKATEPSFIDKILLELNGGKKWKVDEKMMAFIKKMESDITNFSGKDYKELTEKLSKNIESLTSNCTMSGKAHDQLHLWLVPFIQTVDSMKESASQADLEKNYQYLMSFFKRFNQYFE